MRVKFVKVVTCFIVIVNIVVIVYTWRLLLSFQQSTPPVTEVAPSKSPNKHISKTVTIILRYVETYENDITATIKSFLNIFPNIQVLILCHKLPYPPLEIQFSNTTKNVKVVNLSLSLTTSYQEHYPLQSIKTKYVFFIPDETRISTRQVLQTTLSELAKKNLMVAVPFNSELVCLKSVINVKEWTLTYENIKGPLCDSIYGKHAIMVETQLLRKLPNSFLLPHPEALYLQTTGLGIKVKILSNVRLQDGKSIQRSHHAQWKYNQMETLQRKSLYESFQIKKVNKETGTTEWYGCTRDTPRCFGTVLDSMPSYLYEAHWTPPCCMANLRNVAIHVFNSLDSVGIRYWLEAGSLLGAMRNSNILPWDHDVDIGINRDDIHRSSWLQKAKTKPVVDGKGFVWEKATEGNFFRVQFSKTNRIHVNLFPFYSRNGTMRKDGWFTSHKNMEFPDHFLHPMSSIEFIGRQVPSPNNIRDFLELKYGKSAIENPQYPNPKKLKFPN